MSAGDVGWVFDNSPYEGAMFALHLAVADIVNDTHNHELWAAVPTLAKKARISVRSARYGLARMCDDGLLLKLAERPGAPTHYRFLKPDNPCTSCTPAASAPLQTEAPTPAAGCTTPAASDQTPAAAAPELNNPTIPRGTQVTTIGFDAFMRVYPKRSSVGKARKEWHKAIRKKNAADIIAAAQAYRDDPHRKPLYTMSPANWLEGECWDDDRTVERTESNGTKAGKRLLDRAGEPLQQKELTR